MRNCQTTQARGVPKIGPQRLTSLSRFLFRGAPHPHSGGPAMAFIEASSPHTMNTYGRLPIALSHGRGVRVWDVNGREYLDALAGIAVNTLGHGHPKLVPALQDQVAKLIHTSNYYHVPNQEKLAAKLVEL